MLSDILGADLQTAKKTAPLHVGSFSLDLKSSAACGKRLPSRGSTTACLLLLMRCQMLAPAHHHMFSYNLTIGQQGLIIQGRENAHFSGALRLASKHQHGSLLSQP